MNSTTFLYEGKNFEIINSIGERAHCSFAIKSESDFILFTLSVSSKKSDADFLPFSIIYNEKMSSTCKIPGGFNKRDGKPSEREILISRIIDRSFRPLINSSIRNEIQIFCSVYSCNESTPLEELSILGCSLLLKKSNLCKELICGSKIVKDESSIFISSSEKNILMIEGKINELSCDQVSVFLENGIKKNSENINKSKNLLESLSVMHFDLHCEDDVNVDECKEIIEYFSYSKEEKNKKINDFFSKEENIHLHQHKDFILKSKCKEYFTDSLFKKEKRLDGRSCQEIRSISCEVNILPSNHGSALFTRGGTQSLTSLVVGDEDSGQLIENIFENKKDNVLLYYNFLPFATGEVKKITPPNRREIGHAKLAYNAICKFIQNKKSVIKLTSDILSSDGSSSMATVCACSLSLMSSGFLHKHIAGIAMGCSKVQDKVFILSDISAEEDSVGDMDMKVTASRSGITAIQMDVKEYSYIDKNLIVKIIKQAQEGIASILDKMYACIEKPPVENHKLPCSEEIDFPNDKLGLFIGKEGRNIKSISEKTKCTFSIDKNNKSNKKNNKNSDKIRIFAKNREDLINAIKVLNTFKEKKQ